MWCIGCSAGHRQGADTDTSNNQAHRSWLDTSYTGQTVQHALKPWGLLPPFSILPHETYMVMKRILLRTRSLVPPNSCFLSCWLLMFIIYCMQKLIAQPDNSKCRYTDTRLQEVRRRTVVAVDGPLPRHSAFHPSVSGSKNMSVELRHIEYGVELETKAIRRFAKVSIVSYSCPSLMIIASASQFHVYLLWGQRPFSIVS